MLQILIRNRHGMDDMVETDMEYGRIDTKRCKGHNFPIYTTWLRYNSFGNPSECYIFY